MKTNKKLRSIVLSSTVLVLFLIVLSFTASASITETQISHSGIADNCTIGNINGNKIVWTDERNGASDIYMYDLSTKKETQITTSGNAYDPYIYGNRIVWGTYGNLYMYGNVYMYDLTTKKTTRITNSGVARAPVIYGNTILWDDGRVLGNPEANSFYMYNLSTHKETLAFTTAFYPSSPSIYGNKIVWSSSWNDYGQDLLRSDVYMYDISTHKTTSITKNGYASNPTIYGNKIVWQDWRSGNIDKQDIYMCDLTTKKQTQITNHGTASNPAIYGNNIVWEDSRNGNEDIYAYDLKTHQQTHATDKSEIGSALSIYGNKVVWTDYRNGKPDIYMGTISYLPVASFTASPTSGKHPLTVKFTDKSTDVYSYNWNFGDKSTSTVKNPTHKYTKTGRYTVKLTVKNAAGSNSKTMTNCITVK